VVEARVEPRTAHLVVRDNGHGLADDVHGGIGLRSMQQRMSSLGGSLRLTRLEPHGLEVEAMLPRKDRILENYKQ
jgi:signal transduction histidine kinase